MISRLTIDRFEEDIAVLETEDEEYINIPRCLIPQEAIEGSIIIEHCGRYKLDGEATAARRADMAEKMRALFDK